MSENSKKVANLKDSYRNTQESSRRIQQSQAEAHQGDGLWDTGVKER
jgi:hypothetical protein